MAIGEGFQRFTGKPGILLQSEILGHSRPTLVEAGVYVDPQTGALPVALKSVYADPDLSQADVRTIDAFISFQHEYDMLVALSERALNGKSQTPRPIAFIPPYDVTILESIERKVIRIVMERLPESSNRVK